MSEVATMSCVIFGVESYKAIREAAANGLGDKHWAELAVDKKIPWDLNHELYENMEAKGMLHIVTARMDGQLVGYHVGIVGPHLHYKSAGNMCYEDMYFLLPEFRAGGAGARLFMFVEKCLRDMGITKWFISCKVHEDHSELFKLLGFRNTDTAFSKVLL